MTQSAQKFSFSNNVWIEVESGGGLTGKPRRRIRTGVAFTEVTCLSCSNEWIASSNSTGLAGFTGGIAIVNCPACGSTEKYHQKAAFQA